MEAKRIMIIGGRWSPEPFVRAAKKLGCWVLATHYDPHLGVIPGADFTRRINPGDQEVIMRLFIEHRINAVMYDGDDGALAAAGTISSKFNVPGPNPEAVHFSTNKERLRTFCQEHSIPQPPFFTGAIFEELLTGIHRIGGLPAVIKPIDSQWGQGITKIESEQELQDALEYALAYSYAKRFIVEKFIEGKVIVVESFSLAPDSPIILAVSSKGIRDKKRLLTAELSYPAECGIAPQQQAINIHTKLLEILGYRFAFSHSEFAVDQDGEVFLLESTNRGAALFISSLILPVLTKLDLGTYYIRLALGEHLKGVEFNPFVVREKALFTTFQFKEGKIKKINGLEKARSLPGVLAVDLFHREEDDISPFDRHGYMAISSATKENVRKIEERVRKLITLEYA